MTAPLAIVDCNNFYPSCERVFQPKLRGCPVIVLSNNDGCVIARSNEAKALGIEMGAPWHLVKEQYRGKGIYVRSSNYTLYGDMSARVMDVLRQFTPDLEIYSIDEAFLGLAGFESRLDPHVRELRRTVLQWTGIPVSVGVAPSKTLAKVANRFAKKEPQHGGVLVLDDRPKIDAALARTELTDLWGVAGRMAARLAGLGITTPLDLQQADPRMVRQQCSVVMERMVYELRGIPCLALEEVTPDRKSIMASRSFGRPVTTLEEMREAVAAYTTRAAEKLRRQDLVTAILTVFVETNRFKPEDPQHNAARTVHLPVATCDTARLIKGALDGLGCLWRAGFRYSKAGVMLLDLHRATRVQAGLFDAPDDPRRVALMRTMDDLNRRHGAGVVRFATTGRDHAWKLRSEHLSRQYTTRWDELLRV